MSRQINLYHPRYLKQKERLTLANVVAAGAALLLLLGIAGTWGARQAAERGGTAAAAEQQLKAVKAQFEAQTKAMAESKPSPQLVAEVAALDAKLQGRERIAKLLEGGEIGNTAGFSGYLRGFARQTADGLWLTGFTIGSGGNDMEIRGRMLSGSALPEYIRRLGSEKAFQGRSFAALTLNRPEPPAAAPAAATGGAQQPAPPPVSRFVEFVLTPRLETPAGGKS
jgi:hypothetical protein